MPVIATAFTSAPPPRSGSWKGKMQQIRGQMFPETLCPPIKITKVRLKLGAFENTPQERPITLHLNPCRREDSLLRYAAADGTPVQSLIFGCWAYPVEKRDRS